MKKGNRVYAILNNKKDLNDKKDVVVVFVSKNIWDIWDRHNLEEKRIKKSLMYDNKLISTVFLGSDSSTKKPLLFESVVFDVPDKNDLRTKIIEVVKYETRKEAIDGHWKLVDKYSKTLYSQKLSHKCPRCKDGDVYIYFSDRLFAFPEPSTYQIRVECNKCGIFFREWQQGSIDFVDISEIYKNPQHEFVKKMIRIAEFNLETFKENQKVGKKIKQ